MIKQSYTHTYEQLKADKVHALLNRSHGSGHCWPFLSLALWLDWSKLTVPVITLFFVSHLVQANMQDKLDSLSLPVIIWTERLHTKIVQNIEEISVWHDIHSKIAIIIKMIAVTFVSPPTTNISPSPVISCLVSHTSHNFQKGKTIKTSNSNHEVFHRLYRHSCRCIQLIESCNCKGKVIDIFLS